MQKLRYGIIGAVLVVLVIGLLVVKPWEKSHKATTPPITFVKRIGPLKWDRPVSFDSLTYDGAHPTAIIYLGVDKDTNTYYNVLFELDK